MEQISPIYLDGPIAGQELPVPSSSRQVCIPADPASNAQGINEFTYNIKKLAIAVKDDEPVEFFVASLHDHSIAEAFTALLSEQAKKARVV